MAWRLVRVDALEPLRVTFLAYLETLIPAFLALRVKAPGRLIAFLIHLAMLLPQKSFTANFGRGEDALRAC